MFGFVVGTLCLAGLVVLAIQHRRHSWRRFSRRFGSGPLYYAFERLSTTPGQEKAIAEAVSEFRDKAWQARGTLREGRKGLAKTIEGPSFDEGALRQTFEAQREALSELQEALVACAARVHDVLDDAQRKSLGRLLESEPVFPFAMRWHGGHSAYHHASAHC